MPGRRCNPSPSIFVILRTLAVVIKALAHIALLLLFAAQIHAQRSGIPPSWETLQGTQATVFYENITDTDDEDLLAEDEFLNQYKANPYRFAFSHSVSFSPLSEGRWVVLGNGDRIWLMGIHSKGAKSLGLILENVFLPKGAELYVYNEDKTEVYGPITGSDNRPTALHHIPGLDGERIIVEYYEPYEERGEGQFTVKRVMHAYREINPLTTDTTLGTSCHINAVCDEAYTLREQAKSIVLITTAEGSKFASGVLINNAGNVERPYVLTSDAVLDGRSSSMLFTFGRTSPTCVESIYQKNEDKHITGADVVSHNPESGLVLLQLHESPHFEWDLYYSGWNRDLDASDPAVVFFHPAGDVLKTALLDGDWNISNLNEKNVLRVESWAQGATSAGAVGAPLFNEDGQVVGIFTRGEGNCKDFEGDSFIPLNREWAMLDAFLDPIGSNLEGISGDDVDLQPRDKGILRSNLAIFPNPASDVLYVFNGNQKRLLEVRFYNAMGQLVYVTAPDDQVVRVDHLSPGTYIVELMLNAENSIRERLVIR